MVSRWRKSVYILSANNRKLNDAYLPAVFKGLIKITRRYSSKKLQETNMKNLNSNLPTGKTWPIFGSLPSLIAAGASPKLHLYAHSKHEMLGPVFREIGWGTSFVFLSDPISIRNVFAAEGKYPAHFLPDAWTIYNQMSNRKRGLLFMDGEEWWNYRKILNQILMKGEFIESLSSVHKVVVSDLIKKWSQSNVLKNLEKDLYVHSLAFMLSTAMGSSYESKKHKYIKDLELLGNLYQKIFSSTSHLMVFPPKLAKMLKLNAWKNFYTATNNSLNASEDLIKKIQNDSEDDGLLKKLLNAGVDKEILSSLLIDLMIAAGDTTSFTTQWTLYLIGQKSPADQLTLPVKGAVKEALRLYPAAPFLTRVLSQPLDVLGFRLDPGEVIVMSMYSCGRSEANFSNASQFIPERWERNKEGYAGVKNPYAFLPFAMGVRSCVGRKLAETQLNLTVSLVIEQFSIQTLNEVDMILRMIPVPAKPVLLALQQRQ